MSEEGGSLERFPGRFRGVHFPRILGPGRLEGRPGFSCCRLERSPPHRAGNGEREIGMALRKTRGSEACEERAQGLLRGVFAGENRISLAHPAHGRVQQGEE